MKRMLTCPPSRRFWRTGTKTEDDLTQPTPNVRFRAMVEIGAGMPHWRCRPISPRNFTAAEYKPMALTISSSFDAGNIPLASQDGDRVDLEIVKDHMSDFYQW